MKPFAVILREAMARKHMTVPQLAEKLDNQPGKSQIYRYLQGESNPSPDALKRISAVLGLSFAKLALPFLEQAAEKESVLRRPTVIELEQRIATLEKEREERRSQDG